MGKSTVILEKAKQIVNEREMRHGSPVRNLEQIATLWSGYLKQGITPEDVSIMMIMLKSVRLRNDPTNEDSWTDIAGYAEIGCRCTMTEDYQHYTNTRSDDEDDIFS